MRTETVQGHHRSPGVVQGCLTAEALGQPVDELTDHTFVSNPELLAYLEKLMVELKDDTRTFQQILYNTKTWQSASFTGANRRWV